MTTPGIILIGEALVDEFADQQVAGGAPLNVARSLAALGVPARLLSRLGRSGSGVDAAGQRVLASMRRFDLVEDGLQFDGAHASGRVAVHESDGTHRFEIQANAAWDHLDRAAVLERFERCSPGWLYFGSLAQRSPVSRDAVQALVKHAGAQGCLRYLDLNLRPDSSDPALAEASLRACDWLKVNDEELDQLLCWFSPGRTEDGLADVRGLMRRFGLQALVLTRGAQGWALFMAGPGAEAQQVAEGQGVHVERLLDTVGAGDAFSAMLLAGLIRGSGCSGGRSVDLPALLSLANAFAAAICTQRGPVAAEDDFYTAWRARLDALLETR